MHEIILTIKAFMFGVILILMMSSIASAQETIDDTKLFAQLEDSNWEKAMAILDAYAIDLQNLPNTTGVIIVYGGQNRLRGEPQAWSKCIKDYLVNRRGIRADRIIMIDGGYRMTLTAELWATFRKGVAPLVTPSPTIEKSEVRFRKGRIKKWRRLCNI